MASDIANTLKNGSCNNGGTPLLSLPPGTVKAAANTTVAISVATNVHDLAVSFIQASPFFIRSSCSILNMCRGVSPFVFFIHLYEG